MAGWPDVRHFHPDEFDSPDSPGTGRLMRMDFIAKLDELRERVGRPLPVNSGYRTPQHNAELADSVDGSAHTRGCAVDLACRDSATRYAILSNALSLGFTRIGIARTFVHLDMDESKPQEVAWLYG